jgi:hypothetical protein
MKRLILTFVVGSMLAGCATISRGPNQQVRLNAVDAKTNQIVAADCFLINAKGIVYSKSSYTSTIGRDSGELEIYCHTPTLAGISKIEGRINGGFIAANFFLVDLCTFSCLIDSSSGAWSEYPDFVDVSLGAKDDAYKTALGLKLETLKLQLGKAEENVKNPGENASDVQITDFKKKLENSQMALKIMSAEL